MEGHRKWPVGRLFVTISTLRKQKQRETSTKRRPHHWSSDDASDSRNSDYLCSNDDDHTAALPRSRLRPAGSALGFVSYADWEPGRSYDSEPTIHYNVEWGLSVRNRGQAGESELDVVISPQKQLQDWSKFLNDGKTITATFVFYYDGVDNGKPLNGHDDVPEEFRRLVVDDQREQEERQRRERDKTQNRKRRRRESNDSLSIATGLRHHDIPDMVFPTSPLELDLSNEDAIREYSVWHRARVSSEQRGYYDEIEALTLANCFTLDMIASNQNNMYRFYIGERVPKGIAWSYVCYIQHYLKQRERA
uniref:Uncharacterized protein n=1 Tax=Bionectria ochroleuca TaxID=29856 RepID=A0A8H7K5G2_BIOOC